VNISFKILKKKDIFYINKKMQRLVEMPISIYEGGNPTTKIIVANFVNEIGGDFVQIQDQNTGEFLNITKQLWNASKINDASIGAGPKLTKTKRPALEALPARLDPTSRESEEERKRREILLQVAVAGLGESERPEEGLEERKGYREFRKLLTLSKAMKGDTQFGIALNTLQTPRGRTPLMGAVIQGDFERVKFLLGLSNTVINAETTRGETALYLALKYGWKNIAEYLLNRGATLNQKDKQLVLHTSIHYKMPSVAKLLIERGDPNINTFLPERGKTPLFLAIAALTYVSPIGEYWRRRTDPDMEMEVIQLLLDRGAQVNATMIYNHDYYESYEYNGMTALMLVCRQNNYRDYPLKIAKLLIDKGADVNVKFQCAAAIFDYGPFDFPENGDTALMFAVHRGGLPLVRLLINSGADINARNVINSSALLELSKYGWGGIDMFQRLEIAAVLIGRGGLVNVFNSSGDSPLLLSLSKKYRDVGTKLLIELGADVNLSHIPYDTPLIRAVKLGSLSKVQLLLSKGADPNGTNARDLSMEDSKAMEENEYEVEMMRLSWTPLLWCAQYFKKDNDLYLLIAQTLIENGANVNKASLKGQLPLSIAVKDAFIMHAGRMYWLRDRRLYDLLVRHGAQGPDYDFAPPELSPPI
jgi:ankyrin repeat protein